MKQKLAIFLVFGLVVVVLIALNAATYVQKEKTPDNELSPNRSTFNSGTTGSQAFYALLSETGRSVTRWQVPVAELPAARNKPGTFVLLATRLELSDLDQSDILKWVADGGRLVLIDRDPPKKLLVSDPWSLTVETPNDPGILAFDPSDVKQMTSGADAGRAVLPTEFTRSLNAVQPSRLASSIGFVRKSYELKTEGHGSAPPPNAYDPDEEEADEPHDFFSVEPAPTATPFSPGRRKFISNVSPRLFFQSGMNSGRTGPPPIAAPTLPAAVGGPVVHVASGEKNLVVDMPYGSGRIVLVSDPYIVSNAGIGLVDNATLALNLVSGGGTIAFDEYHQGYGADNNRLFRYFEGTPVISIFIQLAALVLLVLISQSRRFARPLPDAEPDRLSKLEYIAAMAELQQRTAAYDLAIENIYADFRRRVSRLVGADNTTVRRPELAELVAQRAKMPAAEIEQLMFQCEDVIHGEPTDRKETVELIKQLRAVEEKLGMSRAARARV